jgi:predicted GNAT family acetyltransferase
VPDALAGRGVGSKLVKGALDQVRSQGLKVVARCPFVKAYIEKHAEYADLLNG